MSFTEIYSFDRDGMPSLAAEIQNAWRGAMAIWEILEERYLPPYIPDYVRYCNWYRPNMSFDEIVVRNGFKPTRLSALMDPGAMKEIWNLADSGKLSLTDKIVLYTTFDKILVKKENLPKVIAAFNVFIGETSLKEQAVALQTLYDDPNCIAVGWNQTSVSADTWENIGGYDEENDENIPYNCLTQNDHGWLFDELKEGSHE